MRSSRENSREKMDEAKTKGVKLKFNKSAATHLPEVPRNPQPICTQAATRLVVSSINSTKPKREPQSETRKPETKTLPDIMVKMKDFAPNPKKCQVYKEFVGRPFPTRNKALILWGHCVSRPEAEYPIWRECKSCLTPLTPLCTFNISRRNGEDVYLNVLICAKKNRNEGCESLFSEVLTTRAVRKVRCPIECFQVPVMFMECVEEIDDYPHPLDIIEEHREVLNGNAQHRKVNHTENTPLSSKSSKEIKAALTEIFDDNEELFYDYIGTMLERRTKTGGYPYWNDSATINRKTNYRPLCPLCKNDMKVLELQIDSTPGYGFGSNGDGAVYVFSCEDHNNQFQCIIH